MLNWKVVVPAVASFTGITFVLCVGYGLVAPARFHASWLLGAFLPGFTWLTFGGFVIGVIESTLYGAWAGTLFTTLYNFFARSAEHRAAKGRVTTARAA
jgi:Zn-dependent protease with chaperone function